MTDTHTHIIVDFSSPYLRCDQCGGKVEGYVSYHNSVEECEHRGQNVPCGHECGFDEVCPTWSPVTGCNCKEQLGEVKHKIEKEKRDGV